MFTTFVRSIFLNVLSVWLDQGKIISDLLDRVAVCWYPLGNPPWRHPDSYCARAEVSDLRPLTSLTPFTDVRPQLFVNAPALLRCDFCSWLLHVSSRLNCEISWFLSQKDDFQLGGGGLSCQNFHSSDGDLFLYSLKFTFSVALINV
jgi:hypothetical protein